MPEKTFVEFNMSLATLERINSLIIQAHYSKQGLFCLKLGLQRFSPYQDKEFYLSALDLIYTEAQTKMTNIEITTCKSYWNKINDLKIKWASDIYTAGVIEGVKNMRYLTAWNEILFVAREYELFLMKTMDIHKMLLRDTEKVEDKLDDGM